MLLVPPTAFATIQNVCTLEPDALVVRRRPQWPALPYPRVSCSQTGPPCGSQSIGSLFVHVQFCIQPPQFEDRSRFIESGIIFKSVSNFCSALVCMQVLQIEPPSRNSHLSADFQPPNSPNNAPPAPVSNGEPGAIAAIGNDEFDVFCLLQTMVRTTSRSWQPALWFSATNHPPFARHPLVSDIHY